MSSVGGEEGARAALKTLRQEVLVCRQCPQMLPPVVVGPPVDSRILLLGQAPGPHEGRFGRPFAWTAGKTLFRWFDGIGMGEERFRRRVYMAAVCRCFPGKASGGGDRVPSRSEIDNCSGWLRREVEILKPTLLIPVGRLAIAQVMPVGRLTDVVGRLHEIDLFDHRMQAVPLPHPSGASTWHRTQPGVVLLKRALEILAGHPVFRSALEGSI